MGVCPIYKRYAFIVWAALTITRGQSILYLIAIWSPRAQTWWSFSLISLKRGISGLPFKKSISSLFCILWCSFPQTWPLKGNAFNVKKRKYYRLTTLRNKKRKRNRKSYNIRENEWSTTTKLEILGTIVCRYTDRI